MRERSGEYSKAIIDRGGKPANVGSRVVAVAREGDILFIIRKEKSDSNPVSLRSGVISIRQELILVEVTGLTECRKPLTREWKRIVDSLRGRNKKRAIREFEIQDCESCRIDIRSILLDWHPSIGAGHVAKE